jgi:putative transposase
MTQEERDGERVAGGGELAPASGPGSMQEWAEQLVARAREDGVALTGDGGLLTEMMRHVLQTGLEVEMAEHLGYEPHERGPVAAMRGMAVTTRR